MVAAGLMALAGASGVSAQESVPTGYSIFGWEAPEIVEPYQADRAIVAPRGTVTPEGRFVISGGATYTYNDDNDVEVQNWTAPEILIQAGILPRTEVSIFFNDTATTEIYTTGFSDTSSGSTDMDAEIKFQLLESDSMLPAVVVFGGVSLPVGSNDLTSDRVDPNAGLAVWFDDVDEVWQFFGSARFTLLEDANEEEFIQSAVSVGSAQKWGSGATTFFEYFGFLNDNDVVEDAHFLQGGLIFEVAPNATIDARVGVGLSDDSADLFAGFGGSFSL
jgi:hypothetical protein